jgi:hypothetical protein
VVSIAEMVKTGIHKLRTHLSALSMEGPQFFKLAQK